MPRAYCERFTASNSFGAALRMCAAEQQARATTELLKLRLPLFFLCRSPTKQQTKRRCTPAPLTRSPLPLAAGYDSSCVCDASLSARDAPTTKKAPHTHTTVIDVWYQKRHHKAHTTTMLNRGRCSQSHPVRPTTTTSSIWWSPQSWSFGSVLVRSAARDTTAAP